MTIGIYILKFVGTDKVYIGQSQNIEQRYREHKYSMLHNIATYKLQEAYDMYGLPNMEISLECDISELNDSENEAIEIYNSVLNGFNTLSTSDTPCLRGETNGNAKYKKEDYYLVLKLLSTPGISWKEIEKISGVSRYVVSHISALESHTWLKEEYPEEYSKLEEIHSKGRMSAFMQGIKYPKIKSPEGQVYEVHHQTNFAKEHNLSQPKLCEVLKGTRKTHKGWTLE